jgi:hypothetical protein
MRANDNRNPSFSATFERSVSVFVGLHRKAATMPADDTALEAMPRHRVGHMRK